MSLFFAMWDQPLTSGLSSWIGPSRSPIGLLRQPLRNVTDHAVAVMEEMVRGEHTDVDEVEGDLNLATKIKMEIEADFAINEAILHDEDSSGEEEFEMRVSHFLKDSKENSNLWEKKKDTGNQKGNNSEIAEVKSNKDNQNNLVTMDDTVKAKVLQELAEIKPVPAMEVKKKISRWSRDTGDHKVQFGEGGAGEEVRRVTFRESERRGSEGLKKKRPGIGKERRSGDAGGKRRGEGDLRDKIRGRWTVLDSVPRRRDGDEVRIDERRKWADNRKQVGREEGRRSTERRKVVEREDSRGVEIVGRGDHEENKSQNSKKTGEWEGRERLPRGAAGDRGAVRRGRGGGGRVRQEHYQQARQDDRRSRGDREVGRGRMGGEQQVALDTEVGRLVQHPHYPHLFVLSPNTTL